MTRWSEVALSDVFDIARGGSPRPIDDFVTDSPEGINWVTIADASEGSKYIRRTKRRIRCEGVARSRQVKPGDFLLTNSMSFGRPYIMQTSGCIHDGWLMLSPRQSELVDADFFYHLLGSKRVYSEFERRAAGATVKNLNIEIVRNVRVALPPIPEQRRIAAILDKADELRAKRQAAIQKLNGLTQSIFLEMFGDPATNPNGWQRAPLESLCQSPGGIKCGPFGTQLAKSEVTGEGVPLWGIKHVNASFGFPTQEFVAPRTAERLRQYSIEPTDIVMTRKGTVGNCAVYPETFSSGIMHSDLLRLRVSRCNCNPLFLAHQLQHSRDVEHQLALISDGAVMPGINVTKLNTLKVLVAPLEYQTEFGRRVLAVNKLQTTYGTSLSALDRLFDSLQDRAFVGEL